MSKKRTTAATVADRETVVLEPESAVAVPESTIGATPPATAAALEILARQRRESEQVLLAAEEILMACADRLDELRHPRSTYRLPIDPADMSILVQAGYKEDRNSLLAEIARRARVKALMTKAGSRSEREEARQAADQAATAEAARRPVLEKIIADAQAELAALAEASRTASERAETMEGAVAALRDPAVLPGWLQKRVNGATEVYEAKSLRLRIIELTNERGAILALDGVASTDTQAVDHCRAAGLEHLVYDRSGVPAVLETAWREYIERRLARVPHIDREIAALESKRAELLAAARGEDFWTKRLP